METYRLFSDLLGEDTLWILAKMTVILSATWITLRLLQQLPARARHAIALGGVLLAAGIPLWHTLAPERALWSYSPAPRAAWVPWSRAENARELERDTEYSRAPLAEDPLEEASPATSPSGTISTRSLLFCGWILGALMLAGLQARDVVRVRRRTREAQPLPEPFQAEARRLANELDIRTEVELRFHASVTVPFTWGWLRPTILLPQAAFQWTPDQRHAILLHELVHIARRDYLGLWLCEWIRCFYWPHPLVGSLTRRIATERELACDEEVLRRGVPALGYAETLVAIARNAHGPNTFGGAAGLAAARRSGLHARIRNILVPVAAHGGSRTTRTQTIALGALLAITVASAPWHEPLAEPPADETWVGALGDLDPATRQHAAWSLGEREARSAVPALLGALQDDDPGVREIAAWALGEIKDRRALPALYTGMQDPDPYVREMIVRAIGEHEDPASLAHLIGPLRSEDPLLRAAAVYALAEIRSDEARRLLQALEDQDPLVRAELYLALAGDSTREELLTRLANEDDPSLQIRLLRELGRYRWDGLPPLLFERARDVEPKVRAETCRLLGRIGDPLAVGLLLRALRDPDPEVRSTASWALDEINPSRTPTAR